MRDPCQETRTRMQDQPLPDPVSAPLDGVEPSDVDTISKVPKSRVLVVERRFRGNEPEHHPTTTSRIRAFQPQTDISVAYSGWEALEILRHGPSRFDFVVIDANVGWMDPVDFVRRAQSVDPVLPAIITSTDGYGAVLVPPDTEVDAAGLLPRQLLRAVLRQLRSAPAANPVHGASFEPTASPIPA